MEKWKPVVEWEGMYEVSSEGRVRRVAGGQGATPGRVLHPGATTKGYLFVGLYRNDKPRLRFVHRLVAEAFVANPQGKRTVNHLNGDRADNRAINLEWATYSENHRHAYRELGRKSSVPMGERQWQAKLTEDKVRKVRQMRAGGMTCKAIAEHFGVGSSTVWNVVKGNTWKHVK